MKRILVTGAAGQVGSAVIAALRAFDGIVVRAGVRDVAMATTKWSGAPGVQPVACDFLDRAGQDAALADCDSLFLLRPPRLTGDFADLIERGRQHGVKHIVFLSVQGAERNWFIPHHKIERRLMSGGVPYTLAAARRSRARFDPRDASAPRAAAIHRNATGDGHGGRLDGPVAKEWIE